MNEQTKEFLKQINREIIRTEDKIEQFKTELQKRISQSVFKG